MRCTTLPLAVLVSCAAAPVLADTEPRTPANAPPSVPRSAAPDNRSVFVKTSLGPTYWSLYGISFRGADLDLAVGSETRTVGFYFELQTFLGSTDHGLRTWRVAPAFAVERIIVDRWRIGGDARVGLLLVRRVASVSSDWFKFCSPGVGAYSSIDLIRWRGRGVFVLVRAGADFVGNDVLTLQLGANVGMRL